jgi:hypothetical protein
LREPASHREPTVSPSGSGEGFTRRTSGIDPGMSRAGEKAFGIAAIVVGLGIVVAAAAGMTLSPILLAVIGLVVVGWLIFYWTVVRQRET